MYVQQLLYFCVCLFVHFKSDAGIKAQVCSLVELLVTTLYQAHALFYNLPEGTPSDPSLPCGLLFLTLETITSQHSAGEQDHISLNIALSIEHPV